MRVLIQRVQKAKVCVDKALVAEIGPGFLLFVGVGRDDTSADIAVLAKKILNLRIFSDAQGKLNLNIEQVKGSILSVSQFTLYADTSRGNRPGFEPAAAAEKARRLWNEFNAVLSQGPVRVCCGVFAAQMQVELVNDGPLTMLIDSRAAGC